MAILRPDQVEVVHQEVAPGKAKVFIRRGNETVAELTWQTAREMGRLLVIHGLAAEEWEKASRIAMDEAMLIRSGAPFALSADSRINSEAKKLAETDRTLRRAMPSIKSEAKFGRPRVIRKRT